MKGLFEVLRKDKALIDDMSASAGVIAMRVVEKGFPFDLMIYVGGAAQRLIDAVQDAKAAWEPPVQLAHQANFTVDDALAQWQDQSRLWAGVNGAAGAIRPDHSGWENGVSDSYFRYVEFFQDAVNATDRHAGQVTDILNHFNDYGSLHLLGIAIGIKTAKDAVDTAYNQVMSSDDATSWFGPVNDAAPVVSKAATAARSAWQKFADLSVATGSGIYFSRDELATHFPGSVRSAGRMTPYMPPPTGVGSEGWKQKQ